uniref:RNA-dependent RNA polymerase n=1 Tax=Soberanes virus TaxID=3139882 RepID=A0AAN0N8B9_9VIRU
MEGTGQTWADIVRLDLGNVPEYTTVLNQEENEDATDPAIGNLVLLMATVKSMADVISKIRGSERPKLEVLKEQLEAVRSCRHEYYAAVFQACNGLEYSGTDVNHITKVAEELQRLEVDETQIRLLENKARGPEFERLLKLTPDTVEVRARDDGGLEVRIVDYSVTVNPKAMIEAKVEKYGKLMDLYSSMNPSLTVACLDPKTGRQHISVHYGEAEWNEAVLTNEANTLMLQTVQLTADLLERVPQEDKKSIMDYLNSAMSSPEKVAFDCDFEFSMKVKDFIQMNESRSGYNDFLKTLSEDDKMMFLTGLYHTSRGNAGKDELIRSSQKAVPGSSLMSLPAFETRLVREKEEIVEEALNHIPSSIPKHPSQELIEESLKAHQEHAKEQYRMVEKPRLTSHLPFAYRSKPDSPERLHAIRRIAKSWIMSRKSHEMAMDTIISNILDEADDGNGSSLQTSDRVEDKIREMVEDLDVPDADDSRESIQKRVSAISNALKSVLIKDDLTYVLEDIFLSGQLSKEDHELFVKGETKISRHKRTGAPIATPRARKSSSIIQKITEAPDYPEGKAHSDIMLDEEEFNEDKGTHSMMMKNGRVIMVKPQSSLSHRKLGDLAGVGKKIKNKFTCKKGEKVKSLDFTSPETLKLRSQEHLAACVRVAELCTKVGEGLSDDEVDVQVKEDEESKKENAERVAEVIQSTRQYMSLSSSTSESDNQGQADYVSRSMKSEESPGERMGDMTDKTDMLCEKMRSSPSHEKDLNHFKRGMGFFSRSHQVMYENLAFVSQMASAGHRVIIGTAMNQALVTFPAESIMKGDSSIPFICITVVLPGDVYENLDDENVRSYSLKCGGAIMVSMGRRVNRSQITGYTDVAPRYHIAAEALNHFRKESGQEEMTQLELSILYLYVNCVNINSSSMLDNMRYMIELCMADMSFVDEYIKDKLMVPVKTRMHMFLYSRMVELLGRMNAAMKTIKMRKPTVDEDGNVDISAMRVVDGRFQSFLFSGTYRKPDHILQEVITLFFCTPKGLHGKHHNSVAIHSTPTSIQETLNSIDPKDFVTHPVKERHQYSPKVLRAATMAAEDSCSAPADVIRASFSRIENPSGSPLNIPTLSSTRSTLIRSTTQTSTLDAMCTGIDGVKVLDELGPEKKEKVMERLERLERRLENPGLSPGQRTKVWRRERSSIMKMMPKDGRAFRFIGGGLSMNSDCGKIYKRPVMNRDKVRTELMNLMQDTATAEKAGLPVPMESSRGEFGREAVENYRFYDSGVILSETLKVTEKDRKEGRQTTVSSMAKDFMASGKKPIFGVRPKGQRTQKDREIFVLDLGTKSCLYLLEHFYKQACSKVSAEKISLPGDLKIIDMHKQARNEIAWCRSALESQAKEVLDGKKSPDELKEVHCIHHNLDMTKWAPKDNLQKFYWTVCYSKLLTVGEKLFMMQVLGLLWEKEMYIDDNIILQSLQSMTDYKIPSEECVFYRMTDGFRKNCISVRQTWLQGQLNYLSSFVHAGAMKLYESAMNKIFPDNQCMVDINVHSDDNETTLCCLTEMDMESVVKRSWSALEYLMMNVCIEISKKKSNVSRQIKSFISIYNIGGEQVYPWVKPLMTTVSGLPYLTLSDDISSAMSKVAEAGSKGAPKRALEKCVAIARSHILGIHGVLDWKTGKNKFAEELEIREELLPTTLGGCHVPDYSTMIICGPKSIDKEILMTTLSGLTGAKSDVNPYRSPSEGKSSDDGRKKYSKRELKKALKFFVVADRLCYDMMDDEEANTHCKGLNFLRPSKFKARRTGNVIPFEGMDRNQLHEEAARLKKEVPHIMLRKPNNPEDLRNYFICVYDDPKFQDSLAGQSPNILKLSHIQQRHRPSYRLLSTGSVNELKAEKNELDKAPESENFDDIQDKVRESSLLTQKELCIYLKQLMNETSPNTEDCVMLWSRYCSSDPEYKCTRFVQENHSTGLSHRKLNLVPKRKPNFSQYSDMVNPLNDILTSVLSDSYAARNSFIIRHKNSMVSDWDRICEMFPRESLMVTHRALLNPKDSRNFFNLMRETENLKWRKERNAILHEEEEKLRTAHGTDYLGIRSGMDKIRKWVREEEERRFAWHEFEYSELYENLECLHSQLETGKIRIPEWMLISKRKQDLCKAAQENMPRDLMRMSRSFKVMSGRVLFTPPMHGQEIMEMALQLRSSVESVGDFQLVMHLKKTLSASRTKQMLLSDSGGIEWYTHAGDAMSVMYETMRVLGATEQTMRSTLDQSTYCARPFSGLIPKYAKLSKSTQMKTLIPIHVMDSTSTARLIRSVGHYTKGWPTAQEVYGSGPFSCFISGTGFAISAEGTDRTVQRLLIKGNAKRLPLTMINEALQEIAKDLCGKHKHGESAVKLSKVLNLVPLVPGEGGRHVAYDPLQNKLVDPSHRKNLLRVQGLVIDDMGNSMKERDIEVLGMSTNRASLTIREGVSIAEITHRYPPDAELSLLSVPDIMISGMRLRDVLEMPNLQSLLKRRLSSLDLKQIIRMMPETGSYTSTCGSMQSRVAMKLCVAGYQDEWLDRHAELNIRWAKKGTVMDLVTLYLTKCADVMGRKVIGRKLRKACTEELERLDELRLQMIENPEEFMDDEEMYDYIENEKEKLMSELEASHELESSQMPERGFHVDESILAATAKIQARLMYNKDINIAKMSTRIEMTEDLFTKDIPTREVDFVYQCQSPIDMLKLATSETLTALRNKQKKRRRERPPLTLEELFTNCDLTPLDSETNSCVAKCIGLLMHYRTEARVSFQTKLTAAYDSIPGNDKAKKQMMEGLLASLDTDTYCAIPSIVAPTRLRAKEPWQEAEPNCYEELKKEIKSPDLSSNRALRCLFLVTTAVRAATNASKAERSTGMELTREKIAAFSRGTRGNGKAPAKVRQEAMQSMSSTKAIKKAIGLRARALKAGASEEEAMAATFSGIEFTGTSATETSEDERREPSILQFIPQTPAPSMTCTETAGTSGLSDTTGGMAPTAEIAEMLVSIYEGGGDNDDYDDDYEF